MSGSISQNKKKDKKTHKKQHLSSSSSKLSSSSQTEEKEISINDIVEFLFIYTAILSLFSDKYHFKCNHLEECILNAIQNIDLLNDFCSCNDTNFNVLSCYMEQIHNYNKPKLLNDLHNFHTILQDKQFNYLKNILVIIFNDIQQTMGKYDTPLLYHIKN